MVRQCAKGSGRGVIEAQCPRTSSRKRVPLRALRITASLVTLTVTMTLAGHGLAAEGETPASEPPQTAPARAQGSGLPVPRFVSLKADEVNLRAGPGRDYPTSWVYKRAGLPLEVVKEFDIWREVRDSEGTQGWVIQSLLSGRRTALVQPWDVKAGKATATATLRKKNSQSGAPVAKLEAGVIANVMTCDKEWCRVSVDKYTGYIEQKKLWGVYEGEEVK